MERRATIAEWKYTTGGSSGGERFVEVAGLQPGTVTLKMKYFTSTIENDEVADVDDSRVFDTTTHWSSILINVIEPHVVKSVQLQEVIHLLESSFRWSQSELFLQATAVKNQLRFDEVSLTHDWNATKMSMGTI